MSVELDYSTFVLLPGAVNPLIGMMMETDVWGTTIIVQDKQDTKPKLNATASEFVSSWDQGYDEEEHGEIMDDGSVDYFDQQEQEELLHVPYVEGVPLVDAMNEQFTSYEDDVAHLWSRRGSLEGDPYGGSRHSSRSSSPSPRNTSSYSTARGVLASDPFGVSHFANVSNSQLLHHQQLPQQQQQPQRLRQPPQLMQQQPQILPQILLQPPPPSRPGLPPNPGRMQPGPASLNPPGRLQLNGNGAPFAQRFQPQNLPEQMGPQLSPSKIPRLPPSNDPRTLRPPPGRTFYRPPRDVGVRPPPTIPAMRGTRMPEAYGWGETY